MRRAVSQRFSSERDHSVTRCPRRYARRGHRASCRGSVDHPYHPAASEKRPSREIGPRPADAAPRRLPVPRLPSRQPNHLVCCARRAPPGSPDSAKAAGAAVSLRRLATRATTRSAGRTAQSRPSREVVLRSAVQARGVTMSPRMSSAICANGREACSLRSTKRAKA